MKRLVLMLLLVGFLPMSAPAIAGDTGTYRILDYRVGLTPHSDGTVAIDYYQKWLVTGGHIPWITVGTPNSDFRVSGFGGAVSVAADASGGGWSGVRLDLDADYQPGQTFEASFSIVQRGLFYADTSSYKLDFTPGWYDRAVTDTLRVSVKFFGSLETVVASPQPSFSSGEEMVWYKYSLGRGERFWIHVSFPRGLFPAGIAKSNLGRGSSGASGLAGAVPFIVIALIILFIILALASRSRRYTGGRTFYGGMFGGGSGGGIFGGGRSTGGGGGFGGASTSCACACVSCACACACAGGGGGGAGCSRKLVHTCPVCEEKKE